MVEIAKTHVECIQTLRQSPVISKTVKVALERSDALMKKFHYGFIRRKEESRAGPERQRQPESVSGKFVCLLSLILTVKR